MNMTYYSNLFGSTDHMLATLLILVTAVDLVLSGGGGLPLSVTFDPPADRVRLGAPLTVRCELSKVKSESDMRVSTSDGISMLLHCPISPWGSFCFQNCKSACVGETPGKCPFDKSLGNVSCQTVVTQEGHVRYEYTIPRLTKEWLGRRDFGEPGFYCRAAGLKTPEVWLALAKEPPTQPQNILTRPATTPAISKPLQNSIIQPVLHAALTTPVIKTETTEHEKLLVPRSDLDARTAAITREILIVGAIAIVFVSVMLNVFCCIRCALIRQYSKTKGPVHMQHLFCMAEEIRNARLVRHVRGNGAGSMVNTEQWDQAKSEIYRFPHSVHEGSYASGSRILIGNPAIQLDAYHPSGIIHGSDLIVSPNCGGMVIGGNKTAFSDSNSNNTAGADVHTRCLPDGRVGTLPSGSAFSLVGSSNVNVTSAGSDRRSKTSSLIMVPGQQLVQVWGAHPGQKQMISSVPTGYYLQQPSHVELTTQQPVGSDGLGSCLGSMGQPDSSLLETYQPSSSGISTLRRNSSSNKEPLLGSTEPGGRSPQNSTRVPVTQTSQQQQGEIVTSQGQFSGLVRQFPHDTLLVLNRSQPMGSSQPQLASTALVTHMNSSNSNPQLMQAFTPVYALVGTSVSQLDSGTGSGSGQLLSADSHSGGSGHKLASAQTSPHNNLCVMSNGLAEADAGLKMFTQDRPNVHPHTSYNRRRMQLLRNYDRRRARLKHRTDLDVSTEDDVSDWSESVLERSAKTDGSMFNSRMSCSSSITEYPPTTTVANTTNEINADVHQNGSEIGSPMG